MIETYLTTLTANDLPDPYKTIAESMGLKTAIRMAELFGGSQVSFQKLDTILYPVKEKLIRSEFTGYNHNELARKHNCSKGWIYRITADLSDRERSKPVDGQINLLNMMKTQGNEG